MLFFSNFRIVQRLMPRKIKLVPFQCLWVKKRVGKRGGRVVVVCMLVAVCVWVGVCVGGVRVCMLVVVCVGVGV